MFDLRAIVSWLRKNISSRDIILMMILVIAYLLTRLINLDKFPIFTDEGIYIHWAKIAWHDATWRFISLTDGRQPLQTWATIPFLKLFPDNALFAGRLFAVTSGLLTLSGLFTTAYYLFSKKIAFITSFLYVITPYFLFHDRIALVDSTVNAGVIWMFLLSIMLARSRRLDYAMILGLISGATLLAKSSVKLFFGLTIMSALFILIEQKRDRINKLISFGFLYCIAGVIALIMYNIQRLSPFFHFVAAKNVTFVLTFHEFIKNPFQLIFSNARFIPYYISSEMAYVIPIVALIGLIVLISKRKVEGYYIALWVFSSCLIIGFVARVLYPRYIMSIGLILLLPAGYLLGRLNKKKCIALIIIIVSSVAYFNYTILFDNRHIPFPQVDRGQYIEEWPAGWGIKEIVDYARERSKLKKVTILAEGDFGMSGDVLDVHLKPTDRNIEIKGFWPLELTSLLDNLNRLDTGYVLIVFSHREQFPKDWPMKKIMSFEKPGKHSTTYLYELYK